jgi:TRAP-type C4-dicarboxylate transport system substrate-binding protein
MQAKLIKLATVTAVTVAVLGALGCGGGSGTDKAGGSGAPVTLRLATPDRAGLPGAKAIERFREEVAKASDGAVVIKPVYTAAGDAPRFDQAVADLVRTAEAEMALVPARAWDEYGVTSLAALQAPFLIRDQAVLNEVVAGELAQPMMEGLRASGVTGLALLPENLRHPFGYTRPLRSPRDFTGAAIRAPRSESTYALLRALGSKPVDITGEEFAEAVKTGRLAGAESAFDIAASTLHGVPTATGNVTFFPKVNVLVANTSALGELPESARDALETAAAHTLDWVKDTNKDERDAALAYCGQGGRVVSASAADIERLVALSEPVYTAMEQDAETKRFIERIGAIAQEHSPETVTCTPAAGATPSEEGGTASDTDPSVLDGIYRNSKTVQDFVAAGISEAEAIDNHGVHTVTLDGGRLEDTLTTESRPDPSAEGCTGTYRLSGDTFIFTWDPESGCTGDFTATWELSDGELHLTDVRTPERLDAIVWGVRPFRKIG